MSLALGLLTVALSSTAAEPIHAAARPALAEALAAAGRCAAAAAVEPERAFPGCSGTLRWRVPGGARVSVDGRGLAPGTEWLAVPAGAHHLSVAMPGGGVRHLAACVEPGRALELDATDALEDPRAETQARRHEARAFEAIEAGAWCRAVAELEAARAWLPAPAYTFDVALALDRWGGRCPLAVAALEHYDARCAGCEAARLAEWRAACRARLSVRSRPDRAELHVDGAARGRVPLALDLMAGAHAVGLVGAGGERWLWLEPGTTAALDLSWTPPESAGVSTLGWVSLGVGVAAIATGSVFAALARSDADALDALPTRAAERPDLPLSGEAEGLAASGRRNVALAVGGWVGGGLLTALGGGLLLFGD